MFVIGAKKRKEILELEYLEISKGKMERREMSRESYITKVLILNVYWKVGNRSCHKEGLELTRRQGRQKVRTWSGGLLWRRLRLANSGKKSHKRKPRRGS